MKQFRARVAQLMERWSYKPEVEGLSPSLGTRNGHGEKEKGRHGDLKRFFAESPCLGVPVSWIYRGVTHPGRTSTDRERGVGRGASASRPDHTRGPRSRHRSSKPNLRELGGKARGSTPPRASKFTNGCVAQTELEQASHKREVGGSTPPTATKVRLATRSTKITSQV